MGLERVLSKMRKRRRGVDGFIKNVNAKSDAKFFDDYIRKSPHWTDRWIHPKTHHSYSLRFVGAPQMTDAELLECRNLVDATSSKDYADSEMGWDADAKLAEMKSPELRYVLLHGPDAPPTTLTPPPSSRSIRSLRARSVSPRSTSPLPAAEFDALASSAPGPDSLAGPPMGLHGFVSFMPTMEDGYAVVYCYEIHLVHGLRRSGLGAQLISLLKDVARNISGVEKVMLTCFTRNESAREFYSRVGFMIDDFSPQPRKMRNGKILWPEHLILSWEVS
ncbi:hypothetical protein TD95_000476 [Thielaviopsis punctulata]|uniref:N-alpha-acetyltransferase 40 n=1 Tax=Thielaviopsis punctulata TaxID=72032 RepID=A0A0F4ZAS0_9PEZI|nr:hypothetical protein TD95_000476 [Thielaviopsis punctulata]